MTESESEVTQSCLTLSDPMDCSLPDFSVHGIFQARVLEWVAISFSRGSSQPKDRTRVSCVAGRFTLWATREAQPYPKQRHWGRRCRQYKAWRTSQKQALYMRHMVTRVAETRHQKLIHLSEVISFSFGSLRFQVFPGRSSLLPL